MDGKGETVFAADARTAFLVCNGPVEERRTVGLPVFLEPLDCFGPLPTCVARASSGYGSGKLEACGPYVSPYPGHGSDQEESREITWASRTYETLPQEDILRSLPKGQSTSVDKGGRQRGGTTVPPNPNYHVVERAVQEARGTSQGCPPLSRDGVDNCSHPGNGYLEL